MTRKTAILIFLGGIFLAQAATAASSLRGEIIALLPQTTGEVAYVDLQELRRSPHYRTIKQRVVPGRFADFERFVRRVGINVDTDLDWLAWGLISSAASGSDELFFGIVQGRFEEDRVRDYFKRNQLPIADHGGRSLYLYGASESAQGFALALLDRSTGVFGTRASVELILDTQQGASPGLPSNSSLAAQITEVNGRNPVWVVMDSHYTRLALSQLLPELAKFPEFDTAAAQFRSAQVRMNLGREASLTLDVKCAKPADAQTLSFLLRTGLTTQGWQTQQDAPELAAVLGRADVRSMGNRLRLGLTAKEDELRALLAKAVKLFP